MVTSVSVIVNAPGFTDAARRLASWGPRVSVGLHLNLVAGRPLSPPDTVRSLVDAEGRFRPLAAFVLRSLTGRIRQQDVARETAAQLGALRAAGIAPTHLDSHRHVHALRSVRGPATAAAAEAGVRIVRRAVEPMASAPARSMDLLKRGALRAAWISSGAAPRMPGAPEHFRGLALAGNAHFLSDLLHVLDALPPGLTELVVHPGYGDAELARWDGYCAERQVELAGLLSERLRARLSRGDITLARFAAA